MYIVISPDATVADCIDNAVALSGYQADPYLAVHAERASGSVRRPGA